MAAANKSLEGITINVIDTLAKVEEAVEKLKSLEKFSISCARRGGGLTGRIYLLQIATPSLIYIFDIFGLETNAFQAGLKDLLESEAVSKVFYDCREDCNILYRTYGVEVKRITDLQLMGAVEAKLKVEQEEFLYDINTIMQRVLPDQVFLETDFRQLQINIASGRRTWTTRPLKTDLMSLAANNVRYLLKMEEVMFEYLAPIISSPQLKGLIEYSSNRYADFYRKNDKYKENRYFTSCRIPPNIVPFVRHDMNSFVVNGYYAYNDDCTDDHRHCRICNSCTTRARSGCSRSRSVCARCRAINNDTINGL